MNTSGGYTRSAPRPIAIGIIGLGNISSVHGRAFLQDKRVIIKSVADSDGTRLNSEFWKQHAQNLATDYHLLFSDPEIDVVDIALPHWLHARVICEALEAGKHVICEKPLVIDPSDLVHIGMLSKKRHRNVYVKQYFRYSSLHEQARDMILGGSIGTPYLVSCTYTTNDIFAYNNPHSWKGNNKEAGGGVWMDIGVHIVDYLREIFGNPISVLAVMKKQFTTLRMKGEDVAIVTLEFRGGKLANILCTAGDTSYGFRWEKNFYGSLGALHIADSGKSRMDMSLYKNNVCVSSYNEEDWWEHANVGALHDIIDRIVAHEQPAVSLREAKGTIEVIQSAYKSALTGQKIELNFT